MSCIGIFCLHHPLPKRIAFWQTVWLYICSPCSHGPCPLRVASQTLSLKNSVRKWHGLNKQQANLETNGTNLTASLSVKRPTRWFVTWNDNPPAFIIRVGHWQFYNLSSCTYVLICLYLTVITRVISSYPVTMSNNVNFLFACCRDWWSKFVVPGEALSAVRLWNLSPQRPNTGWPTLQWQTA